MAWRDVLRGVALASVLTTAACATASSTVQNRAAVTPNAAATCPIFVMWPTPALTAFQGNVGVDVDNSESTVANRTLEVVRERCPGGELLRTTLDTPHTATQGSVAVPGLTVFEQSAAMIARDRGAQYLLAETIQRWNQMRTDDPIGALMTPRNSIGISVRLIRLEPPAVIGSITFTNRSRITLNQDAAHLLNRDFDAALRALLWNQQSTK